MKDDPAAPSRSYLKVEEAFSVLNHFPKDGEIVADLGAAPGGWTWAAIKRGAQVYAIDNGPLKKGPLNHPGVHHVKKDAFIWQPESPVDWLFCDMVEQPFKVMDRIKEWFSNRWCRYSIVNFKYGYSDPGKIIDLIYSSKGLVPDTQKLICRHLFHDRDEITVMAHLRNS
jgi:23S rRNA (cytidine2498-2'-O)-methyltransferase